MIRNQFVHNYNGTIKKKNISKIAEVANKEMELHLHNGRVLSICGDRYIRNVLQLEYEVLTELAQKSGYGATP